MRIVLPLVLTACSLAPQSTDDGAPWEAPEAPLAALFDAELVEMTPPPATADFTIALGEVILSAPGQASTFTVTVSGANPASLVRVGYAFGGTQPGPCYAIFGGVCFDIGPVVQPLPNVVLTDASGNGTLLVTVPAAAPSDYVAFQALDLPYGTKSNAVARGIYPAGTVLTPSTDMDGDGFSIDDGDCFDGDPLISPIAFDYADDGVDRNCDGVDGVDLDGDGFAASFSGGDDCNDIDALVNPGADVDNDGLNACDDCDDTNALFGSTAADLVGDGLDTNCDGIDGVDDDKDGVASLASGGTDCGDDDDATYPGAPDTVGDGVDNNCDDVDGIDGDGDGVAGQGSGGADCDDGSALVYPGADDAVGNGIDNNCDGVDGIDGDRDGFASVASGGLDCDDATLTTNPAAADTVGDGIDTNCDDLDGIDGDGDGVASTDSGGSDCDDLNAAVSPNAVRPAGPGVPILDWDCDGWLGENLVDLDGDTFYALDGGSLLDYVDALNQFFGETRAPLEWASLGQFEADYYDCDDTVAEFFGQPEPVAGILASSCDWLADPTSPTGCIEGWELDCNSVCQRTSRRGDDICDGGDKVLSDVLITTDFACEAFDYDDGDCSANADIDGVIVELVDEDGDGWYVWPQGTWFQLIDHLSASGVTKTPLEWYASEGWMSFYDCNDAVADPLLGSLESSCDWLEDPLSPTFCIAGWEVDCNGTCQPSHYRGDDECDRGVGSIPGFPWWTTDFNCLASGYDNGDCVQVIVVDGIAVEFVDSDSDGFYVYRYGTWFDMIDVLNSYGVSRPPIDWLLLGYWDLAYDCDDAVADSIYGAMTTSCDWLYDPTLPTACVEGWELDCAGTCHPTILRGDGACDLGLQSFGGVTYSADFNCALYAFDDGDCPHATPVDMVDTDGDGWVTWAHGTLFDYVDALNSQYGVTRSPIEWAELNFWNPFAYDCDDADSDPLFGHLRASCDWLVDPLSPTGCILGWELDCAGTCQRSFYRGDGYCDQGNQIIAGVGFNADFSCAEFNFDDGDCPDTGTTPTCQAGDELDCDGNCYPSNYIGDGTCDDGVTYPSNFNCAQFNFDDGDCAP